MSAKTKYTKENRQYRDPKETIENEEHAIAINMDKSDSQDNQPEDDGFNIMQQADNIEPAATSIDPMDAAGYTNRGPTHIPGANLQLTPTTRITSDEYRGGSGKLLGRNSSGSDSEYHSTNYTDINRSRDATMGAEHTYAKTGIRKAPVPCRERKSSSKSKSEIAAEVEVDGEEYEVVDVVEE